MRVVMLTIGSLLPLVGAVVYVASIYAGKSRPQRMTRFLMLVITGTMFATLWAGGDTSGVWLALVSFLQAVFIMALSFKHGMGGRDRLDYICLVLCIAGLALWLASGQSWLGLAASIVADVVAVTPSLVKTIRLPHTELMLFYLLDTIASIAILFAGPFTLQAIVFPTYIALINFVFVLAIQWPRRSIVKAPEVQSEQI